MAADNRLAMERFPDAMTLYDHYLPSIRGGSYRLVLQQSVALESESKYHYYRDQRFVVQAPRYAIDSDEIQAVFPPEGGTGDYGKFLPHVVLRKRSLPWERLLEDPADSGKPPVPWLALLVLSQEEFDAAGGNKSFKVVTAKDLVATGSDGTRLLPALEPERGLTDTKTQARVFDLSLSLFQEICPKSKDLAYLAHVRCVDTANKVPLQMHADGDFSVLMANRFPSEGPNIVLLISLEGWGSLIDGTRETPESAATVRLVTLGSWRFVTDSEGRHTFGRLLKRLDRDCFGMSASAPGGNPYVNAALQRGFVPLEYRPRHSTPTLAWYRGPFAPLRTGLLATATPFRRADAALVFDRETSLMNVSYAAAWELGRLLALASPSFGGGLRAFVDDQHDAADAAQRIETFVEIHRSAVAGERDPKDGQNDPSPAGEKSRAFIASDFVDWLARLVLLQPVPVAYLVADPRLLPRESLRFFHVDGNWVEALADGALSIGIHCSRDHGGITREDRRSALSKMVYQYFRHLQGRPPLEDPPDTFMRQPMSGFVLRSDVVSGWPGIEVEVDSRVETDPTGSLPIVLRMDHLTDGVLLCMVRGTIRKVVFKEPREGLRFGVDSDDKIALRKTTGKIGTPVGDKAKIAVDGGLLRSGSSRGVLDVASLAQKMAAAIPAAKFGSAALALQMIRSPEQIRFEWTPEPTTTS
ncbi:MAG: hypothetical protein GY850_41360 [bacterium]|nr:hypothetical protein [bacterium]